MIPKELNLSHLVEQVAISIKRASSLLRNEIKKITDEDNPSTNIDTQISEDLSHSLKGIFDVRVLSEEDKKDPTDDSSKYTWVIDPIDGTMNFISGSPDFSISVALVDSNYSAILALVYLPSFDELFTAIEGRGAWINGKKIVHRSPQLKIVSYGIPGESTNEAQEISVILKNIISNGYHLRQSGSAALDICRVANCVWEGFFERGLFLWDVAAADLIATEAGCVSAVKMSGRRYVCDYVCCNTEASLASLKRLIA